LYKLNYKIPISPVGLYSMVSANQRDVDSIKINHPHQNHSAPLNFTAVN